MQGLLEKYEPHIARKGIAMALEGKESMLRIFLNQILRRVKDAPVKIGTLTIESMEDLSQAQQFVLKNVAAGKIAPADSKHINDLIESCRRTLGTLDLAKRVQAMEELVRERNDFFNAGGR
jgi:hypothetical protein